MKAFQYILLTLVLSFLLACQDNQDEQPVMEEKEDEQDVQPVEYRPPTITEFKVNSIKSSFHNGETYGGLFEIELETDASIEEQGLIIGLSENIDLENGIVLQRYSNGDSWRQIIDNLSQNATYHIRAFFADSVNAFYSNSIQFNTGSIPSGCKLTGINSKWDFNIGASPVTTRTYKYFYDEQNRMIFTSKKTETRTYLHGNVRIESDSSISFYTYFNKEVEIESAMNNDTWESRSLPTRGNNQIIDISPNSTSILVSATEEMIIIKEDYTGFPDPNPHLDNRPDSIVLILANGNIAQRNDFRVKADTSYLVDSKTFNYDLTMKNPYYLLPTGGTRGYVGWWSKNMLKSIESIDLETNEYGHLVAFEVEQTNQLNYPLDIAWDMAITNDHFFTYSGCN